MSRSWNGSSLVTEFSQFLGDNSTAFQSKVLGWMNDIQADIASRHDWPYFKTKGKKNLVADEEVQELEISPPGAPTVALSAGGSLEEDSVYSVLITFCQDNGVETVAGAESASVTATDTDATIDITSIPVSSESLVT